MSIEDSKDALFIFDTARFRTLIFMHNHPNNSCFSERDFFNFVSEDKMFLATAVCNNGNIHIMKKEGLLHKEAILFEYQDYYEKHRNDKKIKKEKEYNGIENTEYNGIENTENENNYKDVVKNKTVTYILQRCRKYGLIYKIGRYSK